MPKTAMNKDCGLIFGKNNVWPARKRTDVQPKSKSEAVQERSNGKLRRSVAGLDPRHVPTASLFGDDIHLLFVVTAASHDIIDDFGNLPREKRRYGIANLPVLSGACAHKNVVVGEGLQPCRFTNGEAAALAGIGVNEVVSILADMRGDRG